jgi:hypothetical protein
MVNICVRGITDHGVDGRGCSEDWNLLFNDNMGVCGDSACDKVVDTIPCNVKWITDHDAFCPRLRFSLQDTLAKTMHPKTRNLDASDVRRASGTPQEGLAARLNVRLLRYTNVLTAHNHMEFGTGMLCSIADVLSRTVHQWSSALPSMW